jgi:hypothetical protein
MTHFAHVICLPDLTEDRDIRNRGPAYEAGYRDASAGPDGARWWLLQLAGAADSELSDYWEGWNHGRWASRKK